MLVKSVASESSQMNRGARVADRPGPGSEVGVGAALARFLPALILFALLVYLAFDGGGFDPIEHDRVGIAAWWLVLLGALTGAFSLAMLPRRALVAIALLAGFAIWTGLSMIWSESADRSAQEAARAMGYLGVFVLTLVLQRRGGLRLTLGAVAAAIGLVSAVSLLSRLEPEWFPENETIDLLFAASARLNYPLNYWNGLAAMMAIGAPLLLHFATHGRHALARALSLAALPALGLGLYLTLSRGGALALAAALVALVVLHPRRRALLPQLAVAAAGGAVLIWAAEARPELMVGLRVGKGLSQGDEMLAITLVVCLMAGLSGSAVRTAAGRSVLGRIEVPRSSRRTRVLAAGGVIAAVAALAIAADAPTRLESGWEQFKEPVVTRSGGRLDSISGNGRYQWWSAAVDAYESSPVLGIGSGTFEFWWTREGSFASPVVDAHSLYLETLGELGIPGFCLIVAVIGGMILTSARLALRAPPARRRRLAAATAALVAFAVAAGTDWAWELPILPIAFLIVAGGALAARVPAGESSSGAGPRLFLGATAVLAAAAIAVPMLGVDAIRESQKQVRAGDLGSALDSAERASWIEPYSGPAALQEALVLEVTGKLSAACDAAREATREEPTYWYNWLVLSRIEAEAGRSEKSIEAFRRARKLHPSSVLLQSSRSG